MPPRSSARHQPPMPAPAIHLLNALVEGPEAAPSPHRRRVAGDLAQHVRIIVASPDVWTSVLATVRRDDGIGIWGQQIMLVGKGDCAADERRA